MASDPAQVLAESRKLVKVIAIMAFLLLLITLIDVQLKRAMTEQISKAEALLMGIMREANSGRQTQLASPPPARTPVDKAAGNGVSAAAAAAYLEGHHGDGSGAGRQEPGGE